MWLWAAAVGEPTWGWALSRGAPPHNRVPSPIGGVPMDSVQAFGVQEAESPKAGLGKLSKPEAF